MLGLKSNIFRPISSNFYKKSTMAKKDDIANDLSRGRRNVKKPVNDTVKAEKVVEKLHVETPNNKPVKKEQTVRTTLDLPKSIHKAIKIATAQKEMTVKDYIVSLVKGDLKL